MNPSLLLIPDRYKASKLYSQIPDSGAGDLAFTRANDTATRVNSEGLIEKVRTNLVLHSEDFTNAYYTKSGASVAILGTAPNGLPTANLVTEDTSNGDHRFFASQALTFGLTYTFSIYLKSGNKQYISINAQTWSGGDAVFDIVNGSVTQQRNCIGSIESVGNGWFRCSATAVNSNSSATFSTPIQGNQGSTYNDSYIGTSETWFAWGAQMEISDFGATPYIPTTTAAVSVGLVANIPRIDYTGGGCGKLLLEPQRTNLITFSEQFDNAAWTKVQSSVTANNAASPDGFINADKFIANTTSNLHFANSSIANTAAPWTYSVFAKAAGYDRLIMWVAGTNFVGFNLTTGVVESTLGTGITSANIQNYGNGWYRCSITSTSASSGTSVAFAVFNAAFTDGNSNPIFTGNGTDGILIYGAQFEAASYVSSYIPTLGASVTRSADSASKTGISSLIGQSEGTIYWEFTFDTAVAAGYESILNTDNGSFGNTIYLFKAATAIIVAEMYVGGVVQASFTLSSQPAGTYKAAFGYANNNTAFFINGVQVGTTDTSCSVPAMSRIQLGNGVLGPSTDKTSAVAVYPVRLTNSELASLTTL